MSEADQKIMRTILSQRLFRFTELVSSAQIAYTVTLDKGFAEKTLAKLLQEVKKRKKLFIILIYFN